MRSSRIIASLALALMMLLPGCLEEVTSSEQEFDWNRDYVLIDPSGHEDPRMFVVADPVENETLGNATWTVFGNEHGGNCCEHYLAATKEGWILNFGGEYPTWSEDRGLTWQEYRPTVFSQFGCLEPKPTVPGQEGLGEGSIVQATNGDLISMGWFPYPSTSGADQFYAFFYDAENQEWSWCFNRTPEPFYDRSWQVEVVGPINGGLYGNGPWASLVISNFWHQVQNVGGQISTDGLNYDYFGFPDRDENLDVMEVDLSPESLGPEWDFTKPHKEMRAFPVPSGGLYFPNYFIDGSDAFLDTSLNWWTGVTRNGSSLPSQYCAFDSSTALHCVISGQASLVHMLSWDGGRPGKTGHTTSRREPRRLKSGSFILAGCMTYSCLTSGFRAQMDRTLTLPTMCVSSPRAWSPTSLPISDRGILTLLPVRVMTLDSTSPVWAYSQTEDLSSHTMTRPIRIHSSGLRC